MKQRLVLEIKHMELVCQPFTRTSDQERISPYNINKMSNRQVMRIKKLSIRGLLLVVDPTPDSPN